MIELKMKNFENNTEVPISLQIDDKIYKYPKDNLFEHLVTKKGEIIKVIKYGFKPKEKIYVIKDIILGSPNKLELEDNNI
jgi:hypothetical protein